MTDRQRKIRERAIEDARMYQSSMRRNYAKAIHYFENFVSFLLVAIIIAICLSVVGCEKITFEESPCFYYLRDHYYGTHITEYGDVYYYEYFRCN